MIKRHVFHSPETAPALQSRLQAAAGENLAVEITGETVKISRRHALPLLNGFSPVFVGRISARGSGSELVGRFRFHLFAISVIAGFVGVSIYQLWQLLTLGQIPAGYPPDWRADRIQFELQFLGFSAVAIYVAWLAGRPMRERMLDFVRGGLSATTGKRGR